MKLPIWVKSIRFQLTIWYLATLFTIFLLVGALLYFGVRAALIRQTDHALATQAAQIGRELTPETQSERGTDDDDTERPEPAEILAQVGQAPSAPAALIPNILYARLARRVDGKTVALSPPLRQQPRLVAYFTGLPTAKPGRPVFSFGGPDEESAVRSLNTTLSGTPYILQVAIPWDNTEDFLARLSAGIGIAILLFLVLSGVGSWQLIRRTLSPINAIVTRSEQQTGDHFSPALLSESIGSDNEVGHLVGALNRMMARIHSAFDIQRRFTADASHELRTPLTILQGEFELALARERSGSEYRRTLASGLEEVKRMGRIVESLALLARYDAPQAAAVARESEEVDLAEVVARAVEQLKRPLTEKKIDLAMDFGDAPKTVWGDPSALMRVASNLLENAIKYSSPGGHIGITLREAEGSVNLAIEDTGVGITRNDLGHIFDRFYRADKSRANTGGSGLGLSIAQSIVHAHGGSIEAQSELGAGSRFVIQLPKNAS